MSGLSPSAGCLLRLAPPKTTLPDSMCGFRLARCAGRAARRLSSEFAWSGIVTRYSFIFREGCVEKRAWCWICLLRGRRRVLYIGLSQAGGARKASWTGMGEGTIVVEGRRTECVQGSIGGGRRWMKLLHEIESWRISIGLYLHANAIQRYCLCKSRSKTRLRQEQYTRI